MGKADLALGQSLQTLRRLVEAAPHRHAVGRHAAGQPGLVAEPPDGRGVAVLIPDLGGGQLCGRPGEGNFHEVSEMGQSDRFRPQVRGGPVLSQCLVKPDQSRVARM